MKGRWLWRGAALALALCMLAGCGSKGLARPDFPLTEAALTDAQERAGVPGDLMEEETHGGAEGQIIHTLRVDGGLPATGVMSAEIDGTRLLQVTSIQPVTTEPDPLVWEDWKPLFTFAALLYGGFDSEESLYQAVSGQEPTAPFSWEAQLEGGYCEVQYFYTGSNAGSRPQVTPIMRITLYPTPAAYQELMDKSSTPDQP